MISRERERGAGVESSLERGTGRESDNHRNTDSDDRHRLTH